MTSFLNAALPLLLQVNRAEGGSALPWPNGSLLTGKILPMTDAAGALLVLGNYRVRIEVPPNTPMGHVWVQLLQRELPGQFRLLSDRQAVQLLMDMLQQQGGKLDALKSAPEQQAGKQANPNAALPQSAGAEWQKLNLDTLPFASVVHDDRLTLFDEEQGNTRGIIQKDEDESGFMLHGRVDLDTLAAMAFALEGREGQPWRLTLHTQDKQLKQNIEAEFLAWLQTQRENSNAHVVGVVQDFLPSNLGSGSSFSG